MKPASFFMPDTEVSTLCIPWSEYHTQFVIALFHIKCSQKDQAKHLVVHKSWNMTKVRSCIATLLVIGFYLAWILAGFTFNILQYPPLTKNLEVVSVRLNPCVPGCLVTSLWYLTGYFLVSCCAHLNIDESLVVMVQITAWLFSLCCPCCLWWITSMHQGKTFMFSIPLETSKYCLTSLLLQNDQYASPKLTVLWTSPSPDYCAFFYSSRIMKVCSQPRFLSPL